MNISKKFLALLLLLFAFLNFTFCGKGTVQDGEKTDDFPYQTDIFDADGVYSGFELVSQEYIEEIKSRIYVLEHQRTKARAVAIKNSDSNKTFGIGFKTIPENSKGTPHILEHSVLMGSEKYPVKDPFLYMKKSSLYTFMNALTYPDKTIYPIASQNKKDYFHLMDVYLDAVFNPILSEEAFRTEGWRYELASPDAEIKYNGVVYNEMKGNYSSPYRYIFDTINSNLFPDTPYAYVSGGDPADIPKLTYKEFKAYHENYYHPSNSYIYFYGDVDLKEELKFIQENYLKDFDYLEINPVIPEQKPFSKPKTVTANYPIGKGEPTENRTFITMSHVFGKIYDTELQIAVSVLISSLYGKDGSPLRKALTEAGIAQRISYSVDDSKLQTVANLILMNTDEKHLEQFKEIYKQEITKLVENGIDRDFLLSTFNRWEFAYRDFRNEPLRGKDYFVMLFDYWLHGKSPVEAMKTEQAIAKVKEKLNEKGYFEDILKKYFLENDYQLFAVLKPDDTLLEKFEQNVNEELKEYKASLSEEEINSLIEQTFELLDYQNAPEDPKDIATLPKLSLEDIPTDVEEFPYEIVQEKPLILYSDYYTNQVADLNLYFDVKALTTEELAYIELFGDLLLYVGTSKTPYDQMRERINMYTGGISSGFISYDKHQNYFDSFFTLRSKVLTDKYEHLGDILEEIILEADFSDVGRLKELVNEEKSYYENTLSRNASSYVYTRLQNYLTRSGKIYETVGGIGYYNTLKDAVSRLENDPEGFVSFLNGIKDKLFTEENLMSNIIIDEKNKSGAINVVKNIVDALPEKKQEPAKRAYEEEKPPQAFVLPSQVQSVGLGYNIYSNDDEYIEYTGELKMLANYLENNYLYEKVRLIGGAYGVMVILGRNSGIFTIISYRDPNLKETYDAYKEFSEHLADLEMSEDEFNNLIITTLKEDLYTPTTKGNIALVDYLYGTTKADRQRIKEQILNSSLEGLKQYVDLFKRVGEKGFRCTAGNEKIINENGDLFEEIINVVNN